MSNFTTNETTTLPVRSIVEGNIIQMGNKNLIVTGGSDGGTVFEEMRSHREFIVSPVKPDEGLYELVDSLTGVRVRDLRENPVRMLIFGDLIVDISSYK